jgi:mannose-6-phosphate isomerase-like protein (cupin superfamily)
MSRADAVDPKKISSLTEASPVTDTGLQVPFEFVDFEQVKGVPCPCGSSQRGLMRPDNQIASIHRVEIKETARVHYHKVLTETYYFLDCQGECFMELDGKKHPVRPGMAVMIRPGTRHRAVGTMTILNFVVPPFDAHDEWFDE